MSSLFHSDTIVTSFGVMALALAGSGVELEETNSYALEGNTRNIGDSLGTTSRDSIGINDSGKKDLASGMFFR